jgi:MFS family permease
MTGTAANKVQPVASASAWSPFRHRIFAVLWIATVASNVGTWMYAAAAGWQMTLLAPSPLMVSLVQAASTLPVFIFALPAGALADIVDRRRLLIVVLVLLLAIVFLFAVLTLFDLVTPGVLLAFSFVTGIGTALVAPAWQAIVPELVPRQDLQAAVALNSVGINISRAVGPALGGVLIFTFGIASPYFANAASFLGVIVALILWRRQATTTELPVERFVGAMHAGLRYVRESTPLRATLVRALAFFAFASAYWALLPLIARDLLDGGPQLYGILLACIGAGAVIGALFLPRIRAAIGPNHLVAVGTVATAAVMALLALSSDAVVAAGACLIAGAAWIAVLSSLNVAAQVALPVWVKARGLSVYLVVFFGAMTGGSVLWGQVATVLSIPVSLLVSGGGLIIALFWVRRWKLPVDEALDLAPSMHWPAPMVAEEVEHDRGPVMVTIEYQVDPARAADFIATLEELSHERRRDGAFAWGLFEDAAEPGRYLEYFMVESWLEHLRQHRRVTGADRDIQERSRAFLVEGSTPQVSHFLAPAPTVTVRKEQKP